jgi:hypothetical protein
MGYKIRNVSGPECANPSGSASTVFAWSFGGKFLHQVKGKPGRHKNSSRAILDRRGARLAVVT